MSESVSSPPPAAAWLGYGGAAPFLGLAVAAGWGGGYTVQLTHALMAYGAVILSFVGALHWGFAMTLRDFAAGRQALFVWSVVPALLAWVALLLAPLPAAVLMIGGFLAHYGWDVALARRSELPNWYLPLRLRLTTIACVSLSVGGYAGGFRASPTAGDNPVDILNHVTETSPKISRLCLVDELLTSR
jgi:hypothetical protein